MHSISIRYTIACIVESFGLGCSREWHGAMNQCSWGEDYELTLMSRCTLYIHEVFVLWTTTASPYKGRDIATFQRHWFSREMIARDGKIGIVIVSIFLVCGWTSRCPSQHLDVSFPMDPKIRRRKTWPGPFWTDYLENYRWPTTDDMMELIMI